jgi:hypothetical protein
MDDKKMQKMWVVDFSAWVSVPAKTADEAWAEVNAMFSKAFYQTLETHLIKDGEIEIGEVSIDESTLEE